MERLDEVLLSQGVILIMVSTKCHPGAPHPPLPRQHMQEALFTQWNPDKRHASVVPIATTLDPTTDPLLNKTLGTLDRHDVPTHGLLFFVVGGGGGWRMG